MSKKSGQKFWHTKIENSSNITDTRTYLQGNVVLYTTFSSFFNSNSDLNKN